MAEDIQRKRTTEELQNAPLEWANKAIRRYMSTGLRTTASDDRKSGNKRHIVAIDDSLKINYEVIRHIPGQLAQGEEIEELNRLKVVQYKNSLNQMHEEYIKVWQKDETEVQEEDFSSLDEAALLEQKQWLTELNEQLKREYVDAIQLEKKWFLLKETVLEACTRLDLCSDSNPLLNKRQITLDESKGTVLQ